VVQRQLVDALVIHSFFEQDDSFTYVGMYTGCGYLRREMCKQYALSHTYVHYPPQSSEENSVG
jgi:hypothetical protein